MMSGVCVKVVVWAAFLTLTSALSSNKMATVSEEADYIPRCDADTVTGRRKCYTQLTQNLFSQIKPEPSRLMPRRLYPTPLLREGEVQSLGHQLASISTLGGGLEVTCDAAVEAVSMELGHCMTVLISATSDHTHLEETLQQKMSEAMISTVVMASSTSAHSTSGGAVDLGGGCVANLVVLPPEAGGAGHPEFPQALRDSFVTAARTYLLLLIPYFPTGGVDMKRVLLDVALPASLDVALLLPHPAHPGVVVVYRRCLHCEGGEAGVVEAGEWEGGRYTTPLSLTDDQFRNLHGHVFHAVTMDFAPFIDYSKMRKQPGGVTVPRDSMDIRILQEAARVLNFSFVLREPEDGQWGYLLENGSWTGTVGTVQRGEADFSMMLSVTWERTYAVDFTRAYFVEPMTFVMRKPGPLPQWQAPVKPFSWAVWVAVVVSVLLAGPELWLILRLSPASRRPPGEGQEMEAMEEQENGKDVNLSFGVLVLYMAAPIFSEPIPLFPRASSARVLCGLWWFFCILTTTLYRGSLIARLTVPVRSPTLDTLEQLATSSLQWGMLDTYGSGYQLFRASKVPVYQALFQEMEYHNMQLSMDRVLEGNYAFISWKTYFRNLIARDYTDRNGATKVHIAREDFFPGGFGWAFLKSSPYLAKMDAIFQKLIESGLVDKWMVDLIQLSALQRGQEQEELVEPEEHFPRPITIYHLQGIFYIMLGGFILASLTLLGELLLMRSATLTPMTLSPPLL